MSLRTPAERVSPTDWMLATVSRRGAPAQVLAFCISLCVVVGALWLLGYSPPDIVQALWIGSVGSSESLTVAFDYVTVLLLTGTAFWVSYQAGLFNIGGDGQLQLGGLCAVVVLTQPWLQVPGVILAAIGLIVASLAGGLWASIAGVLKIVRGANEVISTLMLNFIAFQLVNWAISGPFRSPEAQFVPQTASVPVASQLPLIAGSPIPIGFVLSMAIAVTVIVAVRRTTFGLRLRSVGLNLEAAEHAGLATRRYRLLAMMCGGLLSGLAGGLVVLGLRYYLAAGWAPMWGYTGIVIALLSIQSPIIMIPIWSLIFGMIESAGPVIEAQTGAPYSIISVIEVLPIVLLFLLSAAPTILRLRAKPAQGMGV